MKILNDVKLDFSDVLIVPKRSQLNSRAEVETERTITTLHSKKKLTYTPVIAANMYNTGSFAMAKALAKHKMITCLHKFYPLAELVQFYHDLTDEEAPYVFHTIGSSKTDIEKLQQFSELVPENKFHNICMDIANGYSAHFVRRIGYVREKYPDKIIMAGNVCTSDMTQDLLTNGADWVKVGIGGGAHCTTRLVAGVGYPQLSAVMECSDAAHGLDGHICSDGGIVQLGDINKALCGGADSVMIGTRFMGFEENNGEWQNGKLRTFGMSSQEAQEQFYGEMPDYKASEGRSAQSIGAKGPVKTYCKEILGAIRSCMTYIGARRIKDMPKCCTFIMVNQTHNRLLENHNG